MPNPHITVGKSALEQESSSSCQTESGETIFLQLLEFRTHLLEAVEELHIRKNAETRFEDQISKLVLEKQDLEWEKESLQHRVETAVNQHIESLTDVKKQFQAKIRHFEAEKGKYQVTTELKDKEINNLKEELRSQQLLKYNMEKKSNELEEKLAMQSRSKDSHLNQLGEVEKRFNTLSKQCAMVKQAHEKLGQNVYEAMRINQKLTSANSKQEAALVSMKKELEEVNNKLIKAKMISMRQDKTHIPCTGKQQDIQKLHQKMNMETEMNKKLGEENVAVRAKKQEVMKSLQQTQYLLLCQTQTVNRVELELQTQREQYQALKHEHEVMRDKSKAGEDKVAQLVESYAASKISWDKEKKTMLDCVMSEQKDLQSIKEEYEKLHQKHNEMSLLAKAQAKHIFELKEQMRNCNQSRHDISAQGSTLDKAIPGTEVLSSGSVQHLAPSKNKNQDCPEDTGAVTELATGGQEALNHSQQSEFEQPLISSGLFSYTLTTNSEREPGVVSGLTFTTPSVSDYNLTISRSCCGKETSESNPDHSSIKGPVDLLSKENIADDEGWNMGKDDEGQEKHNGEEEKMNTVKQLNRQKVQGENLKEGGSTAENTMALKRGPAGRQEDCQGSASDTGHTRYTETGTHNSVEGGGKDKAVERGMAAVHPPETQILAHTITTTQKSSTWQVMDFTETPLAVCEPSHSSQSLCENITEQDGDSGPVNKGCGTWREGHLVHTHSSCEGVHLWPEPVIHVHNLCHDEIQTLDAAVLSQPQGLIHQVAEKSTEETRDDKSAVDFPMELTHSPSQSSVSSSQANAVPWNVQTGGVSNRALETASGQKVWRNPTEVTRNKKQTDDIHQIHVGEDFVFVKTLAGPQIGETIPMQENGQLQSLANDDDNSIAKRECLSSVDPDITQDSVEKSIADVCVDTTMDTVDIESSHSRDNTSNGKAEDEGDADMTKSDTDPSTEPRFSFDLVSVLPQFVQESEQNKRGFGGRLRHPQGRIPNFSKRKPGKVPTVITKVTDLLNAFSVSGNAATSARHHQGDWKTLGEASRLTTATDMESGASLSTTAFPPSAFNSTASRLSWVAIPGLSRAPTSAACPMPGSEGEPSCSQDRKEQQASFRDQISKIEQFLNTETLRRPKRQRTDN